MAGMLFVCVPRDIFRAGYMGILMNLCLGFFCLVGLLWFVFSMNQMWKSVSLLEWQIFIFILSYFPSPSNRSWRS